MNISTYTWPAASLLVALAAEPLAAVSLAQVPSFPGRFIDPVFPGAVAHGECPELGDETYAPDVHQVGTCEPLGVHDLGVVDRRDWRYASYRRRWLVSPRDTASEIEVVLFAGSDASGDRTPVRRSPASRSLLPVWHERYNSDVYRSVTLEVASGPEGGVLIAIDECLNGTGGCAQSFALVRDRTASFLATRFLDSLNRRFPGGVRHGYHINVRTLRGEAAVYSDSDANCCPSRIAEMRLELRGRTLELRGLVLRPVKP
ncbi:MAG TPA: hypothetical protein VFS57_04055 [Gemmatimonadaceae bacterium]|nr:hypothetical protein [Gemmatimonadaceae bacterium]